MADESVGERLTERQAQVLKAVRALGDPAIHPELKGALPGLKQSEIFRVLVALEEKGLVRSSGFDRLLVYTPRVRWVAVDRGREVEPIIDAATARALNAGQTDLRSILLGGNGGRRPR
jgi:DNA-binding HxlR family transcriptional regulator